MEKKLEKHLEFTIIFVNSFLENKRKQEKYKEIPRFENKIPK